jgi:hypothetical protein
VGWYSACSKKPPMSSAVTADSAAPIASNRASLLLAEALHSKYQGRWHGIRQKAQRIRLVIPQSLTEHLSQLLGELRGIHLPRTPVNESSFVAGLASYTREVF